MNDMPLDAAKIKKDFPLLGRRINGKPIVYLDNAATSQKPNRVIDAINGYYKNYNANIHRGIYTISEEATNAYTRSKELAARFIGAKSYANIVYCRNTTEAINLVALSWAEQNIGAGDHVLISRMEHHSNIVPWQLLAKRKKAVLDYIDLTKDNAFIDVNSFKAKLEDEPTLVSFTHVSNVLGTINDAKEMTKLAHKAGAKVLVDGAQSVPHMPVNVSDIGCDFFAFSSHKMLGPAGIGVLYGTDEMLESTEPIIGGGDMIRTVEFDKSTWNELPWKFEAGTPNIEGAIGFGAAIEYLNSIGMKNIREHEVALVKYALEKLSEVKGITLYGPTLKDLDKKAGVMPFNIAGAHPHDIAQIFDSENVAIRSGHHCAMPLVNKLLGEGAVARMSFYLYNDESDIDTAVKAIDKVKSILRLKS